VTCSFVAGIGQHRHGLQERPEDPQDVLAGGGQVMDIAGKHVRNPQRDAGGVKQGLDVPADIVGLPRVPVPHVDRLPLAAGGFLPAPVSGHDLAVQDQVRRAVGQGALQLPGQAGARAASTSITSSRYRQAVDWDSPNPAPSRGMSPLSRNQASPDSACRWQPGLRFPSASRSRGGARPAARIRTGSGPWDVEHDTIGDHAEPFPVERRSSTRPLLPGLRAYQRITAYVRVSALMSRYAPLA
jgi:hypothetical protein